MLFETKIIDNLLPQSYADEIENVLLRNSFPWYFLEDITYSNTDKFNELSNKTPGLTHSVLINGTPSGYFDLVKIIPHLALNTDFKFDKIRAFLQLPINTKQKHNNIHVDSILPHIVCLYYVNDSEGDTYLFNGDITQIITPKKNRVVLFDGSIKHASSAPTKSPRCVLNYNLFV